MTFDSAPMSWHSFPGGQYLPLPYMPSSEAASSVSSVWSFASRGAGRGRDSFRSFSFLATSSGRARPSNVVASTAYSTVAAIRSLFASAAIFSVSSVM